MKLRFWRKKLRETPLFSADDIVLAMYRAILGRDPDAEGMQAYTRSLVARPRELQRILREFLTAPESTKANSPLLLEGLGRVEIPIVSLGTHCFTSEFLKRQGLREWSGPFDWVFSNIPMVTHCIRDDFATFLDRTQYQPVPESERLHGERANRVDHAFYREQFKVKCVFNHHDVHEDPEYAYILRCVERFRAALRSPQPHLFVLFSRLSPTSNAHLQELNDAFRQAGSRHRILAFLVDGQQPGTRLVPGLHVDHDDDQLTVMRFTSVSEWQPLSFADPLDELVLAKLLRDVARRAP